MTTTIRDTKAARPVRPSPTRSGSAGIPPGWPPPRKAGARGRGAAASAIRAGFTPHVIDLFADADTRKLAPTIRCEFSDYPQGLVEQARHVPPMPWMYTGGLENHPDIVEAISQRHSLI